VNPTTGAPFGLRAGAAGPGSREPLPLALFGLGTAPGLLGVSLADELLARHRNFFNRLSQVFVLAMGAWFLWTGLSR
jgi:sulfite exporter TauE/SafE